MNLRSWLLSLFGGKNIRSGAGRQPVKVTKSKVRNLKTVEEAAAYAVENIGDLTIEQIVEIEKSINAARPPLRVDGVILEEGFHAAIYGCRLLKPLEKMVDIKKISDRWSIAWCGDESGRRCGVRSQSPGWHEICQKHWTPFLMVQIERVAAKKGLAVEEAIKGFYPEIESF